jgi:hypothetical protein
MKGRLLLLSALLIAMFTACKKTPDLSKLSSAFVVATSRADNLDFSSYSTYHIPDTISFISNDRDDDDTLIVGPTAEAVVAEIRKNMDARGYTFVERPAYPDLAIRAIAIKQVNTGVVYPPGWWWGYPGYPGGCWYWGCYPPYYPVYPTVYSYTVGDFIMEMFDVKNLEANNNLQAIWIGQAGGVLSSTSATNLDRVLDGVNQAFTQSPYIKK